MVKERATGKSKGAGPSPSAALQRISNLIGGSEADPADGTYFCKLSPHSGQAICEAPRSKKEDIEAAVEAARAAQEEWASTAAIKRGATLFDLAAKMREHRGPIAQTVALETGKSLKEALGETDGAISLAMFMAGEGQRLYGRTTTSGTESKYAMTIREPLGVAALIVAANTPIANVAWKVFPALICGNGAVLKSAEDAPLTADLFGNLAAQVLPRGILSVVHGYGNEAGAALVESKHIQVISFTGSTEVGKSIARYAGERLVRISLELGGKNPLVVCDDADLEKAVKWTVLSAFSNAGQRCAAASRIVVFENIYDRFKGLLLEEAGRLRLGPGDEHDFGPVINEKQLTRMVSAVRRASREGATVLIGGERLTDEYHGNGFYMAPTLIEGAAPDAEISTTELFGPIACLYRARDFEAALALANDSPYGLTACIHTLNLNRATEFARRVQAGVVVVNGGTYGSEPHMPFGGVKQSGNGTREPGTEALDVYSNLKDVYEFIDREHV